MSQDTTGQGGEFSMEFVSPPDTAQQLETDVASVVGWAESRPQTRPETGPMVFGDDWAGVFIRGDNAAHFSMTLRQALGADGLAAKLGIGGLVLVGLADTLEGSRHVDGAVPSKTQALLPYEECVASGWLVRADIVERRHIDRVLAIVEGNKSHAARVLGFDRRTLYRKLARYAAADKKAAR